jgi:hypothetical protein
VAVRHVFRQRPWLILKANCTDDRSNLLDKTAVSQLCCAFDVPFQIVS